jgi:DNA helicase HerA-like ATPase
MQLIGTVSGEVSPSSFNVILASSTVGRGTYIKINHEEYGWVLGKLGDIRRSLNAAGEELVLSKVYTIGYKQEGIIKFPKTPFKPMERIYLADEGLITSVLGLKNGKTGSIYLGVLDGCKIPAYIDLNKTIRKHVSILAMTGAGKSYTVGVILEELLKNDVPIVIIDPHGEYSSLKHENDDYDNMMAFGVKPMSYAKKITEYTTNTFTNPEAEKISLRLNFTAEELSSILPVKLADKQKLILYEALRRLDGQDYSLEDLIKSVSEEKEKDKWKIISVLESMQTVGIFDGAPLRDKDIVKAGHATIIDLKGSEPWVQQLVVARIAKDLFKAVKNKTVPAFFLLIEEAHNFCPERGFGEAMSSDILRTVASEGRKFGMHLCVVSQRPAKVDKNVLSQCNTQIILKVTNPNDLRAIGHSIEGFTSGLEDEIKQLSVGQAIVVGECVEQPITVNIRARETRHVGAVEAKSKSAPRKPSSLEKTAQDKEIKPEVADEEIEERIEDQEEEEEIQDESFETAEEAEVPPAPKIKIKPEPRPERITEKNSDDRHDIKIKGTEYPKEKPKRKSLKHKFMGVFLKDDEEMKKKKK